MKIRKAEKNDIPALALLMEQLGYQTTEEEMKERFLLIEANESYYTLVAEDDGEVIGMVGLCKGFYYEKNGIYARILAFVVDENYRNVGIGKQLILEAEKWAFNQEASGITLTSGNRKEREVAHQFYKKMGYNALSIGFVKSFI